jgi:transposase-like protein
MKETLTCASCGKSWKRELKRGRKPKLCKKCIADLADSPVVEKVDKTAQRTVVAEKIETTSSSAPTEPSPEIPMKKIWNMLQPRPSNWKTLAEETADGSSWRCPKCKWTLDLLLPVTDVPSHKCTPASRSQRLERLS